MALVQYPEHAVRFHAVGGGSRIAVQSIMEAIRIKGRPSARTIAIEDLLDLVNKGKIRVPQFQRPLRWRSSHVLELFDSVYRGFPIGVLLFSKEGRKAETLSFGPLKIPAPDAHDALVVIDGQQRVTSFAASLLHPDPAPRGDIFAIWFDLEKEEFRRLENREPPPSWLPLNVAGDSYKMLEWLDAWNYRSTRPELVKRAIALGKAIREYQVPAYVVEEESEEALRLIFKRINTSGVGMLESEVFQALHGNEEYSIQSACDRLANTGFGSIKPDWFLRCLKAVEGMDPRRITEHASRIDNQSIARTEEALRRTQAFLMDDAGIHHAQLLPYQLPLIILARFFHVFPQPMPRNRLRLTWWVWRGALTRAHAVSSQAAVRSYQKLVSDDETLTVSSLLAQVPRAYEDPDPARVWHGKSVDSRLCALGMIALEPRNPGTSCSWTPSDIHESLRDGKSLGTLFLDIADRPKAPIAGRMLASGRKGIEETLHLGPDDLAAHGITPEALDDYENKRFGDFDRKRGACLKPLFGRFFRERSGIGENDRPAIAGILELVSGTSSHD